MRRPRPLEKTLVSPMTQRDSRSCPAGCSWPQYGRTTTPNHHQQPPPTPNTYAGHTPKLQVTGSPQTSYGWATPACPLHARQEDTQWSTTVTPGHSARSGQVGNPPVSAKVTVPLPKLAVRVRARAAYVPRNGRDEPPHRFDQEECEERHPTPEPCAVGRSCRGVGPPSFVT
jgi:hypothetical protein